VHGYPSPKRGDCANKSGSEKRESGGLGSGGGFRGDCDRERYPARGHWGNERGQRIHTRGNSKVMMFWVSETN
jgi:hypothetical protein